MAVVRRCTLIGESYFGRRLRRAGGSVWLAVGLERLRIGACEGKEGVIAGRSRGLRGLVWGLIVEEAVMYMKGWFSCVERCCFGLLVFVSGAGLRIPCCCSVGGLPMIYA